MSQAQSDAQSVLAIIPARGGSKGVHRKNLQSVGGKPLIAYSISTAIAAKNISRVIVSTDDQEIAEIALHFGAEVPFLRPPALATDSANVSAALLHMRNELFAKEGYVPTAQVVMYPTHPFRKVSVVEELTDLLLNGYRTVTTCKEVIVSETGGYVYNEGPHLRPLLDHGHFPSEKIYHRAYGYFLGKAINLWAHKDYAHILKDDIELIDIDTYEDLMVADQVLNMGMYDFEL